MATNYAASQYKEMAVKTASRGRLLIMLYEAAIQNVKKAIIAIEKKNIQAKSHAIGKAHDIINEFVVTLDFNVGGQLARDLERLYNFMTEQLVKANAENSSEPLKAVQKLLDNLLSGWREAVEQVEKTGKGK